MDPATRASIMREFEAAQRGRLQPLLDRLDLLDTVLGTAIECDWPEWSDRPHLTCKTTFDMRLCQGLGAWRAADEMLREAGIRAHLHAGHGQHLRWTISGNEEITI